MASVLELGVSTGKWDAGLKKAKPALDNFVSANGGMQQALDKDNGKIGQFVKMMGEMESTAKTAKGQLNDYKSTLEQLTMQYNKLTDAQKQTVGQDYLAAIDQIKQKYQSVAAEIEQFNKSLQGTSSNSSGGDMSGFGGMLQVFGGNMLTKATEVFTQMITQIGDLIDQSAQLAQESQGVAIAFERLGRPELMNQLKEATHGTVSELELMKAAVKFDDFKLPVEELGTLLAFAQQKAKDTGQSVDYMVDSIVTGLGRKSLMILDNLGLSASEIKERMKETGDMTSAVAEIIRDNMAKSGGYVETAADRAARAAANQKNAMMRLGQELLPLRQGVTAVFNGIATGAMEATAFIVRNKEAFVSIASAVAAYTLAVNASVIATKAHAAATAVATTAQKALNLAMKANPWGLAAAGIAATVTALFAFNSAEDKATQSIRQNEETLRRAKTATDIYKDTMSQTTADLQLKYDSLKNQWESLKTTHEKTQWINANKQAFNELGISVNGVKGAEDTFEKNTEKVVEGFKKRAEAAALAAQMTELYKQKMEVEDAAKERYERYKVKEGDAVPSYDHRGSLRLDEGSNTYNKGRYRTGRDGGLEFTAKGAEKHNHELFQTDQILKGLDEEYDSINKKIDEGTKKLAELSKTSNTVLGGNNSENGIKPSTQKDLNPLQQAQKEISALTEEALTADEARRKVIKEEIADLQKQVEEYKKIQDYVTGKGAAAQVSEAKVNKPLTVDEMRAKAQADLEAQNTAVDSSIFSALLKDSVKSGVDVGNLLDSANLEIQAGIDVPDETWQAILDQYNELREQIGMEPIKLNFDTGKKVSEDGKHVKEDWKDAAKAVQSVGTALQQIEDPGAKVAGLIGQAIANIALGFAQATAKDSKFGIFGWIAAIAGGLGTMISTISAIKSATSGSYAEGGIVPGNSYSGDRLMANVNSGELILNKAQQNTLAAELTSKDNGGGFASMPYVTGEKIVLGINNWAKSQGKGQLVFSRG